MILLCMLRLMAILYSLISKLSIALRYFPIFLALSKFSHYIIAKYLRHIYNVRIPFANCRQKCLEFDRRSCKY